jgi:hypothetical protein
VAFSTLCVRHGLRLIGKRIDKRFKQKTLKKILPGVRLGQVTEKK